MITTLAPGLDKETAFRTLLETDPSLSAFYKATEEINRCFLEEIGVPLGVLITHSHFTIFDGEVVIEVPEARDSVTNTGQRVLARVRPVFLKEVAMSSLAPRSIVRLGKGRFLVYELLQMNCKVSYSDWSQRILRSDMIAELDAQLPDEYLPYSIFVNYYEEYGEWITAEDRAGAEARERIMVHFSESSDLVS